MDINTIKDKALSVAKRRDVQVITAGLVGAAIGSELTFIWTKKQIEAHFVEVAEKEIADAKEHYRILHKEGYLADPETAAEVLIPEEDREEFTAPIVEKSEILEVDEEPVKEVVIERNIFVDNPTVEGADWDIDEELKNRTEEAPYVISKEEYDEAEPGYDQISWTWFDGDDVLADEGDQMIDEVESCVGHANLERFGHGSEDGNVVYVRNDRLEMDIEITRSQGNYAREVLGFDDPTEKELRHSQPVRRFRHQDE